MEVELVKGNIENFTADALVYSTNQNLNLTGGVGKSLVDTYGLDIQYVLDDELRRRNTDKVEVGTIIKTVAIGMPWKKIFHVVATDLDYQTNKIILQKAVQECLESCELDHEINSVVFSALGCGYGNLSIEDFVEVLNQESIGYRKAGVLNISMVCRDI